MSHFLFTLRFESMQQYNPKSVALFGLLHLFTLTNELQTALDPILIHLLSLIMLKKKSRSQMLPPSFAASPACLEVNCNLGWEVYVEQN